MHARCATSPAFALRERIKDHGRFRVDLRTVPIWLIDSPLSRALLGAASALDRPR